MLQYAEKRGLTVTEGMLEVMKNICERARQTCEPPTITRSERLKLGKLACDCKVALIRMNIPVLSKNELKYMKNYWRQQRVLAKYWGCEGTAESGE